MMMRRSIAATSLLGMEMAPSVGWSEPQAAEDRRVAAEAAHVARPADSRAARLVGVLPERQARVLPGGRDVRARLLGVRRQPERAAQRVAVVADGAAPEEAAGVEHRLHAG